jgi:Delta3-Delta2-enoyl-CoA isomerase
VPQLDRDGEVFILNLDPDSENRFSPGWLGAVEAALDELDDLTGPRALVTAGSGKVWTNGLDLEWLTANPGEVNAYLERVQALLARTLASPVVTVAALNGHAFGAGAMWALAQDFRVMRVDRGFFCLPEVDLGLTFTPGMLALVRARLNPVTAHEASTTGRRYGGDEAMKASIVDSVAEASQVRTSAIERARPLAGKATPVRRQIKEKLYEETLAKLRAPAFA